jgi:hypothetical protein
VVFWVLRSVVCLGFAGMTLIISIINFSIGSLVVFIIKLTVLGVVMVSGFLSFLMFY